MANEWTIATLKEHLEIVIDLNDRRYKEVDIEKQKALLIEGDARKVALSLASDDLKRAIDDLKTTIKPLVEYVSSQQGRSTGFGSSKDYIQFILTLLLGAIAIYGFFIK